jgi:hypothetical protein
MPPWQSAACCGLWMHGTRLVLERSERSLAGPTMADAPRSRWCCGPAVLHPRQLPLLPLSCAPDLPQLMAVPLPGSASGAGAAMELLSYLCITPVFYHRLMVHDPSGAAPLRLVLTCLALLDAPLAAPPYSRLPAGPGPLAQKPGGPGPAAAAPAAPAGPLASFALAQPPYSTDKGKGAAELLVARGCALLVMLAEFEEPSYMDQLFEHQEVARLARELLDRAATFIAQVWHGVQYGSSTQLGTAASGQSTRVQDAEFVTCIVFWMLSAGLLKGLQGFFSGTRGAYGGGRPMLMPMSHQTGSCPAVLCNT